MKYKVIILLIVSFFLIGCMNNSNNKFKEEYESLNGKTTINNKIYRELNINKKNNIKYKTPEEIIDIIKGNNDAVIYFGFAACPWCRTMVENLIEVTNELNIENVYYLDIYNIRNTLKVDDNGKIYEDSMGSISYYEIVELLKNYLDDYNITDKNNNKINTNTKRIYAPNVVVIKDGKIMGLVDGVSNSVVDPYGELTTEMKSESYNELKNLLSTISNNVCGLDEKC